MTSKYYYAIPLGVLRQFIIQNEGKPDSYTQLFELLPEHILSEEDLKQLGGKMENRGIVIY